MQSGRIKAAPVKACSPNVAAQVRGTREYKDLVMSMRDPPALNDVLVDWCVIIQTVSRWNGHSSLPHDHCKSKHTGMRDAVYIMMPVA